MTLAGSSPMQIVDAHGNIVSFGGVYTQNQGSPAIQGYIETQPRLSAALVSAAAFVSAEALLSTVYQTATFVPGNAPPTAVPVLATSSGAVTASVPAFFQGSVAVPVLDASPVVEMPVAVTVPSSVVPSSVVQSSVDGGWTMIPAALAPTAAVTSAEAKTGASEIPTASPLAAVEGAASGTA